MVLLPTMTHCINCLVYGWPGESVPVFRCVNCKFVSYCSPQCQKEHWVKVHKKQCKTLAGKVKDPVSTHLPDSCPGCKEEKELGTKTINSQHCPIWGCLMKPKNTKIFTRMGEFFPSAVELGEMVRRFPTRTEHTVYIMQLIIKKLTRTRSRLANECKDEMTSLEEFLEKQRYKFMVGYHHFPTHMEKALTSCFQWDQGLLSAVPVISTISRNLGTNAGDPYCAWETFKLLVGFLLLSTMNTDYHKDFDQLNMKEELPREVKHLFDQLGTSSQFEEKWDKVLAALESGLVDHSNLVEIICGGSKNQKCCHCKKSVIIEQVLVMGPQGKEVFKKPSVTFRLGIFSCDEMDCIEASVDQEVETFNQTSMVLSSKMAALVSENTCDHCSMIGKKVHRCGVCKTKVYCSEECQLMDWNLVHSKICNEGDMARKVKGGKKLRERARKKRVDDVISLVAEDSPFEPNLKQWYLDNIEQIK